MEIPDWFGPDEYYATLYILLAVALIWLFGKVVSILPHLSKIPAKDAGKRLKKWWRDRNDKDENNFI